MAQYNENELNELAHGALVAVEGWSRLRMLRVWSTRSTRRMCAMD